MDMEMQQVMVQENFGDNLSQAEFARLVLNTSTKKAALVDACTALGIKTKSKDTVAILKAKIQEVIDVDDLRKAEELANAEPVTAPLALPFRTETRRRVVMSKAARDAKKKRNRIKHHRRLAKK